MIFTIRNLLQLKAKMIIRKVIKRLL